MFQKNVGGQGLYLYAWNTAASQPFTLGASTITGSYSLDGVDNSGFATPHPTEMGGGVYWQIFSPAETNGNAIAYRWSSSTAGILIYPAFVNSTGVTFPAAAPGASGGLLTFGTGNGQLSPVAGNANLNLAQLLNAARATDSIADTSYMLNDALVCAIAAVAAQLDASSGTSLIIKTASTGTVLRTKALTLIAAPGTVPDKAV